MKKKLTALIASVLAVATLTGCLSSTAPKTDDKSGSASGSTSTAASTSSSTTTPNADARVFRIGAVSNPTDIMAEAGQMFCDLATERLGGEICKNLFLCNRQKTQFYLLLIEGGKRFHTRDLSGQLGVSRLSFAGPEDMQALLGVQPGSVSVLGLPSDREGRVRLLIDRPLLEKAQFGCHPCRNTSTLLLRTSDVLERLLPALGHPYTVVDLPETE